jgi:hypothetical protein
MNRVAETGKILQGIDELPLRMGRQQMERRFSVAWNP